jgi:heme exporter protein D
MELGPHASFILTAYGAAAFVVVSLIAWVMVDHRRQQCALADLEAKGAVRRSPDEAK